MSRRNQDLVSRVRFEVDSRMANATMQALQTHAEKLNQQVTEVNASIKALGDVPDDNPALLEYRKQLRRLNSDLKDVNTTMKDYTRGVKAAGELYRHYAMGNIEDMSIKAIRAGVNGMKKRLDNLKAGGDPGDAEEMRLIEAITTEADVVVKRFKTDYQHVVEEIARGGTVTEQTLKRTRDGLADLMQTAETEAEKNELTNYWQKVGAAIEAVAVENRRLRGEVADREEAMRIAYATDHDGSQQAIRDAESRADAARRENDELRQRLDLKQQQRRELEQEMGINSMQQRALMDRRDELKAQEKEDRAIRNQRVDDANKEVNAARRAAKTQQQAYDEQKQTVEKLRTEVQGLTDDIRKMGEVKAEPKVNTEELARLQEIYNQKVERRKQLEHELDAIKNRSWTDDPEKKRLEEEIAKLNELIAVADKYKKKFAKMSDSKYEEGYMGGDSEVREALHISSDPQKSIWGAVDYLKGAYHDRSRASLADFVKDQYPDDNTVAEYQQAAERVAKGIVQNAQENFRRAIYKEIQDGNWTTEAMEQQLDIFRSQFQNDFRNARPGELKDDPEYHYYKYIIEQMEKYIEVARQVEAERGKIAGGKEYLELARQKDDIDQPREGLLWQRQRRDFDSATIKTDDIDRRRKEDERVATEAVAKAKDEEAEAERKLTEKKKQSATATAAQTEALKQQEQELESLKKDLADATTDLNRSQGNLAESLKPLEELGLKEADLEDKAKLRAAAEKKVLEIMEAQANVEKEVAEQSRKIISELKPNALGGTKADQDFYAKNKNAYAIDDNIDDVMDRIGHLETVSKLKNGRKFSDDTYWDPDDELDESEAIVMTDKEKQYALDELRVLKQHVREVILKAIREVGDVDKAVLEVTGGDGVAEDAKFGEQINDKISDLKDKIQEQITTTLESYEDILDEVDRDEKLSKQEVEHRVNSHIENLKENVARDRDDIDFFQGKVNDANAAIAAKDKEIELTKQQTTATNAQTQSSEQLAQKQEQLSQKTAELNQQQDKLNGMVDETVTANQRLAEAEQEQTDARNAQAEAKKHKGEAVKKVEDELRGLTDEQLKNAQAYSHLTEEINTDTAAMQRNITTEQEATREADRLRSGSIDKMEQALARLRESNRKLDPTIDKEEWERGERAIGQLTLRLEELKKQSAELRREPVLDMMTQRMDQLGTLSRDALAETRKFWQAMYDGAENDADKLREIEDDLKRINTEEQKRDRKTLEERAARLQNVDNYSVGELHDGIEAAKRLQDQYHLTDDELQQLSVNIVAAETRIAKVGVEAERQAQRQREQIELMQQQLANGSALTESALKAQVSYWQRLADDPKAAAEAVAQYTANMKQAQDLLDVKERVDIRMKAGRLDNMDGYSVSELREGIDAAKKMQDTFRLSNDEVQQLSEKIVAAEVRISQFSVESERQAQRQREQIALMEQQLANGSALTESALKAQVNYWQRLADDPKAAAEAVAQYTANMKQAQDLLDQSQRADIESKAGRLQNLGAYSISEIHEGIDAAKKMQDTFHLTDAEVQQLSEDIVAAEKHVSQFSVENERAAQKQREQVATMEQQLQGMTAQMAQHNSVSVNALKAQHSYWQKLIDDPKTAAENLQQYQDNLAETERLQRRMVGKQGQEALDWFRGGMDADASANDIKERAAAMKEWRDTLPKETQADVIAEIDGYLKAAGVSAKKAAEDVMDLKDALDLAEKAGDSKQPFNYSAQEIQAATKALELRREELIKQIRAERDLGNAVDAQEKELDDLTKKLRSLKFEQDNVNMSQEKMRTLIETPANAVNLDELRAAIKRADGQLRQMQQSLGQNSDEYKRFAEQVRQAKNVMKEMEGQAKASATAWEKAFSRLKTYVVMYMGFNEVWQKMSNTARDLMDLSDRMGEVGKTTQMTAEQIGRLTDNLKKIDTRTSLVALTELSAKAGQLGLKSAEDVMGFTEAANKMLVALPEMGADGATQMMKVALATGEVDKIRKQMEEGTIDGSSATAVAMEKIASTIDQLRANSAAAAPQITDFVKRVGAVGAQSNISINQVAALGSTVDALGMRVEMSATALSRMIPAIRNNAFEVAKAIGMAPEALRKMFDEAGGGMNAMLAIFQHIKDAGMNPDDIEKMLGMGGIQDIMKDLNQQGARAGIVFAGLSQNVDVLREHLGIANKAYEENIAIQQEYDRMNETTAAKWERLKNQFEELFVGDASQQWLGVIIDGLRSAVDLIIELIDYVKAVVFAFAAWKLGIGGAIWTYLINPVYQATIGVHSLGTQIKRVAATWRVAWRSMDAATKANMIMAIATAVYLLGKAIVNSLTKVSELDKALGELDEELAINERKINRLVESLNKAIVKSDEAAKKQKKLEEETEGLRKEVDKLRKTTDGSAEATEKLNEKEEALKKKEGELKTATEESNKANDNRLGLIKEINSKYGNYLGYLLSEATDADLVASAHWRIVAALKEEWRQKGLTKRLEAIQEKYNEDIEEHRQDSKDELGELPRDMQDYILERFRSVAESVSYDIDETGRVRKFVMPAIEGLTEGYTATTEEQMKGIVRYLLKKIVKEETVDKGFSDFGNKTVHRTNNPAAYATPGAMAANLKEVPMTIDDYIADIWGHGADDGFGDYLLDILKQEREMAVERHIYDKESKVDHATAQKKILEDINKNAEVINKTLSENKDLDASQIKELGRMTFAITSSIPQYEGTIEKLADYVGKEEEVTIENAVNTMFASRDEKTRKKILDAALKAAHASTGGATNPTDDNPFGSNAPADSTTYTEMTAEQLVNRREQMNKFVNSIQTDTDVKAVLNEDKALKKAIEAGMSSDMRTVIEWYNTERLKIQDELHARHLTNTGDWLDPKKERGAKKQFRDEMDAYLHELDAYYTERKTRIEEAGTDEGLTEAEIRNRTLANEMEWQQRRAELQKLYSRKQKEVTQEELEAIYHIISDRTGDTESFVKAQIAKTNQFVDAIEKSGDKGAAIVHRWMSQVELDTERSYLKGQQALTKQMKAIEDIIDKERPFNGITKQLRESLSTMDILTGDMRKEYDELMKAGKDMRDFNERQGRAELQRTTFLLGQAEQAYSTTIDRVMQQMREKNMGQWADWLSIHPEQQEALMAQLRQTYDAIQDAIKKEASQLKKQAEIMWNNILVPGGDGKTTMKQMLDRTVAQLGIDQGRVSRANSLIGAGASSERVADKLAIQQMRLQLTMQEHYYNLMKKQGRAHVDMLNQQADAAERRGNAEEATRKRLDAQHAEMALNLATAKEETELAKQREEIIARTEESQNRLYTELRSWADLLTSSLQGVFEASHAGDAEYYNERAKLDLTGKGGPGAGTYVVIDDAGTSDATAHYEYLDERQALERQHEIEVQNAQAEAWRKLMDDLNMKMSEQITDWLNAAAQNASVDANTDATLANTEAIVGLTAAMGGKVDTSLASGLGYEPSGNEPNPTIEHIGYEAEQQVTQTATTESAPSVFLDPNNVGLIWEQQAEAAELSAERQVGAIDKVKVAIEDQFHKQEKGSKESSQKMTSSTQSAFAKMTAAANLYGIAYQAMSNDNLSAAQKFSMMAIQAAGQSAITALTVDFSKTTADAAINSASVLGKLWSQLGWGAVPVYAIFTGLLGGLMGLAASKIAKSKSEIAQATGTSVSAGRLATGMLTYAEGNVNELTDPASLTPGRQYNVDGADGKTYRARYMGKGAKTHITNGPEFHLVGEAGPEAIIDARTTRLMRMDDTGIWRDIQTLYNGGSISGLSTRRRRGTGVRAFADGNVGEFEEMADGGGLTAEGTGGMSIEMLASLQASIDRQSDLLENALVNGIKAVNKWTGSDGIPAMYNKMQKEAQRHGEKYL